MGKLVQVKAGFSRVWLPNGRTYDAGQQATLTDVQYANVDADTKTRVLTLVDGGVPDPAPIPDPFTYVRQTDGVAYNLKVHDLDVLPRDPNTRAGLRVRNPADSATRFEVSDANINFNIPFAVYQAIITGTTLYFGATDPNPGAVNGSLWGQVSGSTVTWKVRSGGVWV